MRRRGRVAGRSRCARRRCRDRRRERACACDADAVVPTNTPRCTTVGGMSDTRHEFSQDTIRKLCERVGSTCSNPDCAAPTKGPHSGGEKAISVGMACHVHAASPGGPRHDAEQSEEERRSIHNGIWLCRTCGTLIDTDEDRFPAPQLRAWRAVAELAAFRRVGKPSPTAAAPSDGLVLSEAAGEIMRHLRDAYVAARYPNYKCWMFTPEDQEDPNMCELSRARARLLPRTARRSAVAHAGRRRLDHAKSGVISRSRRGLNFLRRNNTCSVESKIGPKSGLNLTISAKLSHGRPPSRSPPSPALASESDDRR